MPLELKQDTEFFIFMYPDNFFFFLVISEEDEK